MIRIKKDVYAIQIKEFLEAKMSLVKLLLNLTWLINKGKRHRKIMRIKMWSMNCLIKTQDKNCMKILGNWVCNRRNKEVILVTLLYFMDRQTRVWESLAMQMAKAIFDLILKKINYQEDSKLYKMNKMLSNKTVID